MDKFTNFLASDPLSTEVGQLIDRATSNLLEGEDWALNMEICDYVNQTDEGAKDAVKALKKKLQQNAGKNSHAIELALTVAETCVKNCGSRLHVQIASRDFLDELVKVLSPKNNPSQSVQERVLLLIQSWADAFRGKHELREVERIYQELRAKGIEFPAADLDRMAPIYTPARTAQTTPPQPAPDTTSAQLAVQPGSRSPASLSPQTSNNAAGNVTGQQRAKLARDLDAIKTNCAVFSDMLVTLKPGEEPADDLQLMDELEATCREMQHRLLNLIGSGQVHDEALVSDMLKLNDDLNGAFLKYERHTRARNQARGVVSGNTAWRPSEENSTNRALPNASASTQPSVLQPPPPINRPRATSGNSASDGSNLIDLGGDSSSESAKPVSETKPEDEREQLASLFSSSATVTSAPATTQNNFGSGPFTSPYRSTLPPLSAAGYEASGIPSSSAGLSTAVNAKAAGIDSSPGKALDQLEANLNDVEDWLKQRPAAGSATQPDAAVPPPPPRSFEKPPEDANSPFGL